jgi:flagellin-like hook-associated protein FlgL
MPEVNLSKAVRSNLLSLQSTAASMAKTQERLATGLKVNTALDNPTNFFTAASLNSRASDMANLLDSMSNGIKTIEAADNGLTSITKTVESMQSALRQARQDKSFKTMSYTLDTAAIGTATAKTLSFEGGAVGTAPVSINLNTTGAGSAATAGTVVGGAFTAVDFENGGANDGTISFDLALDGASSPTSISIGFADLGGVADTSAVTAAELAGIINTKVGSTVASVNGSGGIDITSTTTGAASEVEITNFTATNGATGSGLADGNDLGDAAVAPGAVKTVDALVQEINSNTSLKDKIRASNDNGKLRIENLSTEELTVTGIGSDGEVDGTTGTGEIGGNTVRKNLVTQFNELRDQLDKFADDASFNGINLLRGDKLKLTFNETGTSTIDIQAKNENGDPIAINNTTLGIDHVVNSDFDLDSKLDGKLEILGTALGKLRSQASSFGSNLSIVQNRTDFTKNMINTLETGAANLTLADTNEEAANLLALQTRQQLSSTALSMASQADQAVLRLF